MASGRADKAKKEGASQRWSADGARAQNEQSKLELIADRAELDFACEPLFRSGCLLRGRRMHERIVRTGARL